MALDRGAKRVPSHVGEYGVATSQGGVKIEIHMRDIERSLHRELDMNSPPSHGCGRYGSFTCSRDGPFTWGDFTYNHS